MDICDTVVIGDDLVEEPPSCSYVCDLPDQETIQNDPFFNIDQIIKTTTPTRKFISQNIIENQTPERQSSKQSKNELSGDSGFKKKKMFEPSSPSSSAIDRLAASTENFLNKSSKVNTSKDRASLVGELVSAKLRALPLRKQVEIEKKINDIFYEHEMEHFPNV